MRKSSIFVLASAALAAGVISARPASAQIFEDPSSTIHRTQPLAVRVGAYFATNSKIRRDVGQTFPSVGLDYHLHQEDASSDTFVSLDYIDRGAGGYHMRVVPLTYGIRYTQDISAKNSVYYGGGLGVYYTNIDVSNDVGGHETNNDLLVGGFVNLGVNLNQDAFLDLRYHITTTSGTVGPGGPQLSVGFRF